MNINKIIENIKIEEINNKCQDDLNTYSIMYSKIDSVNEFIGHTELTNYDQHLFKKFDLTVFSRKFKNVLFIGTELIQIPEIYMHFIFYSEKALQKSLFKHLIVVSDKWIPF